MTILFDGKPNELAEFFNRYDGAFEDVETETVKPETVNFKMSIDGKPVEISEEDIQNITELLAKTLVKGAD